jgi:predicted nucleic acid-binding protein
MRFVLDASAALPLLVEEGGEKGENTADGLFREGGSAVVPTLFIHEVTNALVSAIRRKRVDAARAVELLDGLASLPITVDARTVPASGVLLLAVKHGLTAYDAGYLELALSRGEVLVSNDAALLRAAAEEGLQTA